MQAFVLFDFAIYWCMVHFVDLQQAVLTVVSFYAMGLLPDT